MDYQYLIKKIHEIQKGDILFNEIDENNMPISAYIVLELYEENKKAKIFYIDEKVIVDISYTDSYFVYYLGNIEYRLSIKELMKNVQKRYIWLGIDYDQVKILINLTNGNVEKYDYILDSWVFLDENDIVDDGYTMILTITNPDVKFKINFSTLKVQIKTPHTLKFKNYNNFLLGLESECVFNADNELELSRLDNNKSE